MILYNPKILKIKVFGTRLYFLNQGLIKPVAMLALTSVTKTNPPIGTKLITRHIKKISISFVYTIYFCIVQKPTHLSNSFHCDIIKNYQALPLFLCINNTLNNPTLNILLDNCIALCFSDFQTK